MSSMALHWGVHLRRAHLTAPESASACASPGILARIFAAIDRSRQRRAEQEAGRFIANHGGRLTDDIERQIGEQFIGRGFPPYVAPRSSGPFLPG
jgi:hypothetical protein